MIDTAPPSPRLQVACMILSSVLIGLVITMLAPFRVADCGPADPMLLRYLGGPFLHSTGDGIPSSLESRIWAGPFFANVAVFAAGIFAIQYWGSRGRPPSRPWVLWTGVALAGGFAGMLLSIVINVDDMQWTLTGPPVTAEACDIGFEFRPDQRAWQPEVTP